MGETIRRRPERRHLVRPGEIVDAGTNAGSRIGKPSGSCSNGAPASRRGNDLNVIPQPVNGVATFGVGAGTLSIVTENEPQFTDYSLDPHHDEGPVRHRSSVGAVRRLGRRRIMHGRSRHLSGEPPRRERHVHPERCRNARCERAHVGPSRPRLPGTEGDLREQRLLLRDDRIEHTGVPREPHHQGGLASVGEQRPGACRLVHRPAEAAWTAAAGQRCRSTPMASGGPICMSPSPPSARGEPVRTPHRAS